MTSNELFQRPAHYWLKHAERYRQTGDFTRAAVLQRHAVRAEPGSDAARMSYALTLRALHCYEASNREAFAALAAHPEQTVFAGLIGQNMLAMGLRSEGLDALDLYFSNPPGILPPWHDNACDLAEAYDYPFADKRRHARLEGLLRTASRRIARGDGEGAAKALRRSQQKPFRAPMARRELLWAAAKQLKGDSSQCLAHVLQAVQRKPFSPEVYASSATLLMHSGEAKAAGLMLYQAAMLARTPAQEQLVCLASDALHMPHFAQGMLSRSLRMRTSRFPACYNLCVALLKLGRLSDASRYIHLCREIDPDDAPAELLFQRVIRLENIQASPAQVQKAARSFSYYGACSPSDLADLCLPIWPLVEDGLQPLADALGQDDHIRRRFLFLLTLPLEWPALLLSQTAPLLPPKARETLLREVLVLHPGDLPCKKYAALLLRQMDAPRPYLTWTRDRLLMVDPDRLHAPVPTFRQRFLTRRILQAVRFAEPAMIPWAIKMLSALSTHRQLKLIADPMHIWPMALAMRWRTLNHQPPLSLSLEALSPLRLSALKKALITLRRIERKDGFHADHRL